MEQDNNESKNKKRIKLILLFIIVFVVIFCGIYAATLLYNRLNSQPPEESTGTTASSSVGDTEKAIENPIDFQTLQQGNDEIYAWIKIDGTKVDYPIVQNESDDSFYLKHKAEDKSWSASGAIYTELVNNKNFNDPITVIYGHNGYSDTMFTTLHYFEKTDFFESHPYFYIYTPKSRLTYQVISAFKYDDRHIMNSFFFADATELDEFQKMLQNPVSALKNVRTELDTQINSSSKIVILSTCITNQKSNRYLVCGVLVKDEKTY
ncbi:MAG: class B sortase [Eubacterium sp.]